jgi:Type I phosphodiesterase / nucleotide pyrophosphatase
MYMSSRILIALALALSFNAAAVATKTKNVVLIVSDGLRWEEVFTGAEEALLNEKNGGNWTAEKVLREKYWSSDPKQRRQLLLPFFWTTIATQGQLFGNALEGSSARVTNGRDFSYPGYNEMITGAADPRIDTNEYGPNPNVSVFEWLAGQPSFAGNVQVFAGWDTFHDIFNEKRSHLPIRAGANVIDTRDQTPRGRLLTQLYRDTTRLDGPDPFDSFLNIALLEHLQSHRPRVLFVGFGDTDSWAHMGRYDALLDTAHAMDSFVAGLWARMQSMPQYRGTTTFIITADHGRGHGPEEWKEHGAEQKGSENIWIAVLGPDTPALGERKNVPPVTQSQIAATIAELLGQDYRRAVPQAAESLLGALAHQ